MNWLEALPRKHRRGSLPRCLILTDGEPAVVAGRLTSLVDLDSVRVGEKDAWMPRGLPVRTAGDHWDASPCTEARLGECTGFLTAEQREIVTSWWLVNRHYANTPNWDVACTATIDGQKGLILVEAKAHANELKVDGKKPGDPQNHEQIGAAIRQANEGLNGVLPGWSLSRDSHYQLANRFAWSCKIASVGVPVVLVYLGFLNAGEMSDQGELFADPDAWERAVKTWSQGIVPEAGWERRIETPGSLLQAARRSIQVDLIVEDEEFE